MAQFTDFYAYREAYFADPTANGPTAHPTGSAQQFDGQPSPQDAGGFDVFLFNQSSLGDGAFDGLVSKSAGVSDTGYIPGVEDMRTFAQLGSGRELSSLQGFPHGPNPSQYARMQNDMQTGRNRSWSASSRESTMSATGNGSATLFPAIPPNQYFSASPNISSMVLPESGTSHLLQGPYASHAESLQQQQRSTPISSVPTQPKRMSTALRKRLAAVQQPQQSVPSLASTTRGQFAAPSMLLPVEPGQRKRRAQEPESDDPGLDTSSQRSRRGARSGQPAKRHRRGSAPGVEDAQPADQMIRSTPFATPPFAPGFQLEAAVATGPYYAPKFPLAPMPEQDDHALDDGSAQQLQVQQPSVRDLPGSKKGSQRNLSAKMRQELARRKAAREAEREARRPASNDDMGTPFAPFDTLFALEQHAPDPSAGQSSRFQMPANEYSMNGPMDDWLGRALSEGQHKMVNGAAGGGDASADWYKHATNPDAMSGGSSSRWEAGTMTPGPNGEVFFDPRFAGDYDYDGNLDLHLDFVSVPLPSTPLEAEGSFGSHGGPSHTNPAAVPGFESSRCEHGMCPSSGCPSHATAHLHTQAFGDYDFAPSSAFVDNEGNGDDVPIAESSKAGGKRTSASRARGKDKKGPVKRGRKADASAPAGGSASGNTPKSSGSRVQGVNKYTPANPPRLPAQLPEIVQGHTPCPFCQHPIRTALKNSVLPSMCQVKEHLFGYNDNPPCPALVYWLVSWPKGGDLVGVAVIGEIIVRQWPDEVKGANEEEWFPYRMWGKKTGLGGELLKWWNGLSQERKDEILGKGKGE